MTLTAIFRGKEARESYLDLPPCGLARDGASFTQELKEILSAFLPSLLLVLVKFPNIVSEELLTVLEQKEKARRVSGYFLSIWLVGKD